MSAASTRSACIFCPVRRAKILEKMAQRRNRPSRRNRASHGPSQHLHTLLSSVRLQKSYKFVVIEDLQGKRLERKLATTGRLPPAEACRIARQAALGLARLHAMGQVHAELRPANIWIKPNGLVKLLLFPLYRDPFEPDIQRKSSRRPKKHRRSSALGRLSGCPELIAGDRLPDAQERHLQPGLHALSHARQPGTPRSQAAIFNIKFARHQSEKPVVLAGSHRSGDSRRLWPSSSTT